MEDLANIWNTINYNKDFLNACTELATEIKNLQGQMMEIINDVSDDTIANWAQKEKAQTKLEKLKMDRADLNQRSRNASAKVRQDKFLRATKTKTYEKDRKDFKDKVMVLQNVMKEKGYDIELSLPYLEMGLERKEGELLNLLVALGVERLFDDDGNPLEIDVFPLDQIK